MERVIVETYFALVRAGLWEQDTQLIPEKEIEYSVIYQLAEQDRLRIACKAK